MRQFSWVGLGTCVRTFGGWPVLVAVTVCAILPGAVVGCASAAPVATTPTPEPDEPSSLLVTEAIPASGARATGPVAGGTPVFQVGHQASIQALDISPDGRLALIAGFDGSVSVLDFATGATRATRRMWVSHYLGGLHPVRFDPTGTRVLLHGYGPPYRDNLVMWDLLTDTLHAAHTANAENVVSPALSSDGAWVVSLAGPVLLQVRSAADLALRSSTPLMRDNRQPLLPNHLWLSPSSARVLAARDATFEQTDIGRGRPQLLRNAVTPLYLFDTDGARVAQLTPQDAAVSEGVATEAGRAEAAVAPEATSNRGRTAPVGFRQVAFRPTGGMLMTLTAAGAVQLRHPLTGEVRHTVALPAPAADAQWSRAGEVLLVRELGDTPHTHIVDPATGAVSATVEEGWPFESLRAQDGSLVLYSVRTLDAFSASGEARSHPLAPHVRPGEHGFDLFRVSADGARALYLLEGVLHFVDLPRGVELAQRPVSDGPLSVWGALWVPNVGVIMTTRLGGVLFRPGVATPVACAAADAVLLGEGPAARVRSSAGECGLDDTSMPDVPETTRARAGAIWAASADGATQVVSTEDDSFMVEDARTGRLRMRVPATARTSPECDGCLASYALSDNGAMLAVWDATLPLSLFDTRTGRRVMRFARPDYTLEWVTWNSDASAVVVAWQLTDPSPDLYSDEAPEPGAGDAPLPPLRLVVAYDSRGRELAKLEVRRGFESADPGAAFAGTQLAIFLNRDVRVVDLRSRAVTGLVAAGPVLEAAWHGPALRLVTGAGDDESAFVQALFAAGATTPYAQFEGPGVFTPDAHWVFRCRRGQLERVRVEDLASTTFGTCLETSLFPSPDGRFVALPQGDHLRVVREDGMALRLAALTDISSGPFLAYGVEEATGRFAIAGTTPSETRLTYRQAGPATEAPVVPYGAVMDLIEPDLLGRFLGP